jgi:tRNA-dihydrouridine synthase B
MTFMKIGNIDIDKPLALSPMEDVTDFAFRTICKRMGADLLYTEFTSSEALIRDIYRAREKARITESERPIAIQIFGSREESLENAVKVVEEFKPDFIDINCGCWVKNHVKRGEGAALLRDLDKFKTVVKSVVNAAKLPVTVKTRLGWDQDDIVILDAARMLEDLGVAALAVHCRTRSQGHKGEADWSWLAKLKKTVSIPIIGNGDIKTPQDAKRMFETGCDGVMIGRGAIENPWIFDQIKHYLRRGTACRAPPIEERINLCVEHLKLYYEHKGVKKGIYGFRKHFVGYLKGLPNVAQLRSKIMQLESVEDISDCLYQFLETSATEPSLLSNGSSVGV